MTSLQYFGHILVKILPNTNKMDIFRIYIERAVEKCPRWNFQELWRPRNEQNKSGNNIAGHPPEHSYNPPEHSYNPPEQHFTPLDSRWGQFLANCFLNALISYRTFNKVTATIWVIALILSSSFGYQNQKTSHKTDFKVHILCNDFDTFSS